MTRLISERKGWTETVGGELVDNCVVNIRMNWDDAQACHFRPICAFASATESAALALV